MADGAMQSSGREHPNSILPSIALRCAQHTSAPFPTEPHGMLPGSVVERCDEEHTVGVPLAEHDVLKG